MAPRNTLHVTMLYDLGKTEGLRESRDTRRGTEARSVLGCRGSQANRIPFPPTIWDRLILRQVAVKNPVTNS